MAVTYLEEKSFFFETAAQSPSTKKPYAFNVVRFTGAESLSRPYEFDVTIVTLDREVDLEAMLNNPCTLYLRPGRKLPVHGILSTFEQLNEVDGHVFFRAVLVPRLWQLSLYDVSEIYLDLTVPDVIEKVLKEGGLGSGDYELKLVRTYRPWSFICQYQETHLNFISRWMEREGIFYFFEQTDAGEKLIVSDTQMVHVDLPDEKLAHYSPPSGMEVSAQKQAVTNFICRQVPVPKKVTLQDFNHRKSPPIVQGEAEVSASGRGEVMIYGEHVKNNQEAVEYAKLRAQEILCRQRLYLGEGTAAFLRIGYFFGLDRHYRASFNRKYLLTGIEHNGSQAALLMAGVGVSLSDDEQRPYYRNRFEAMEDDLQFRPERKTPKPRFFGTINAKVEGEGDGQYAELDEFGRYKVKFPFDRSDRLGQKASRWIRMAQPYAGPDEGMHFPLRKGAEVLLTFADGDPDRPIIASAVPSAEAPSMATDATSSTNMLRSAGGNFMHFHDQDGQQRILFKSPTDNSWIRCGAPNDPPGSYTMEENASLNSFSDYTGTWNLTKVDGVAKTSETATMALNGKQLVYRLSQNFNLIFETNKIKTAIDKEDLGASPLNTTSEYTIKGNRWKSLNAVTMSATAATKNNTPFYREKTVVLRVSSAAVTENANGIRIQSAGNIWLEAVGKHADYMVGGPATEDSVPNDLKPLWESFYGAAPSNAPSTMTPRTSRIILTAGDQIHATSGRFFDFGWGEEYDFGPGYKEGHDKSNATIRIKGLKDAADVGGPAWTTIDGISKANGEVSVEKKFGPCWEYQYAENATSLEIEVNKHGVAKSYNEYSEEWTYTSDGKLRTKTIEDKGKGTKVETTQDDLGSYVAFSAESDLGGSAASFKWSSKAEAKAEIEMGVSASFKFSGAVGVAIEISAEFNLKLDIKLGGGFTIKTGLSLDGDLELGLGTKLEIDKAGKFQFKATGFAAEKAAAIEAADTTLKLENAVAKLGTTSAKLDDISAKLATHKIRCVGGTTIQF